MIRFKLENLAAIGRFADAFSESWDAPAKVQILGATGSGKSSLLDLLTGYLRPTAGHVLIQIDDSRVEVGRRVWPGLSSLARRIADLGVGRSFQNPERFGAVTAAVCLRLAIARRNWHTGVPDELPAKVTDVLTAAGVNLNARVQTLSFGQTRLLGIACACLVGTKSVVLDEPAAGLATDARARLSELIDFIAARGALVISAEHDDAILTSPTAVLRMS